MILNTKKGRANQMNVGALNANGEILLFLHADTILPLNAIEEIFEILSDKNISAGAFDLSFDSNSYMLKLISFVASLRSRFTKIPYGDQAIFIRKEVFKEINMYENIDIMEDINLMQKLKKQNHKIKILKSKVITSAIKYEKNGILFTSIKNIILSSLYYIGVDAKKLARFY